MATCSCAVSRSADLLTVTALARDLGIGASTCYQRPAVRNIVGSASHPHVYDGKSCEIPTM